MKRRLAGLVRWSMGLGLSAALGALLLGGAGCGAPEDGDAIELRTSALTGQDVMGFETLDSWTPSSGTEALTTTRTQGAFAYALTAPVNFTFVNSASIESTTPNLQGLGAANSSFAVDFVIPTQQPNPFFFGSLQLLVSSPFARRQQPVPGTGGADRPADGRVSDPALSDPPIAQDRAGGPDVLGSQVRAGIECAVRRHRHVHLRQPARGRRQQRRLHAHAQSGQRDGRSPREGPPRAPSPSRARTASRAASRSAPAGCPPASPRPSTPPPPPATALTLTFAAAATAAAGPATVHPHHRVGRRPHAHRRHQPDRQRGPELRAGREPGEPDRRPWHQRTRAP